MKLKHLFSKKKRRAARAAVAEAAQAAAALETREAAARAAAEARAPYGDWTPGQVHRPGDTREAYMERILARIAHEHPGAASGIQRIRTAIDAIPEPEERAHAHHHLARLSQTYAMVPEGPGALVDIAASPLIAGALRDLKNWRITPVEILAFDYEKDPLPFDKDTQEGVMLCEVLEHFVIDPLFCLNEINRILKDDGFFILTTPNSGSWFTVYQALRQMPPNRWPVYAGKSHNEPNHIHAREYLVSEIAVLMEAAGFEVEELITRDYGITPEYMPLPGFETDHRGETIFCRARKKGPPRKRYVKPIYLQEADYLAPVPLAEARSGPLARLSGGVRQGLARLKRPAPIEAPTGELLAQPPTAAPLSAAEEALVDRLRAAGR